MSLLSRLVALEKKHANKKVRVFLIDSAIGLTSDQLASKTEIYVVFNLGNK